MVAEFEADLIRARSRDGMAVARANRRLRGRHPKITSPQQAHLTGVHAAGIHATAELAELFGVARAIDCARASRPRPTPDRVNEVPTSQR